MSVRLIDLSEPCFSINANDQCESVKSEYAVIYIYIHIYGVICVTLMGKISLIFFYRPLFLY